MLKLILKNQLNLDFIGRMVKWHFNYYMLHRGTPVSAGLYITDACNARCVMCNVWKRKKPSTVSRVVQEKAIDALASAGCYYYAIGGGEPTLVKDLPDRLAYAARKLPYVRFVTNGLAMTPELARALNKSGMKEISISIDGADEYHNLVRGVPDAAERVWNCLDLIYSHAPELQVVINSVITSHNLEGVRELGNRLAKFPGIYQKYLPVTFHELFGTQDTDSLSISLRASSQDEIDKFLDDAISNPKIINSSVFLKKAKRYLGGERNVISEQKRCLYPYHSMEFDTRGFAYPCSTGMEMENGLHPDSDLGKYLKSQNYRSMQKKLEACTNCQGSMMLCYYEPRLNFPFHNLLYYMFRE